MLPKLLLPPDGGVDGSGRGLRLSMHLLAGGLALASFLLFWAPLRQWLWLSLNDQRYSHLIAVPVLSACVLFLERRKVFAGAAIDIRRGLLLLSCSLASYLLLALWVLPIAGEFTLSLVILSILLVSASVFALCYGKKSLRTAGFSFLLLLVAVPIPSMVMDKIISVLQRGSAELTHGFFQLAGVPMFRNGVRFELPDIGIEVAKECSSIHSGWALLITGLLLAHLFLKSGGAKISLSLLTVPVAMFTNAVRIVTLWFLATKVDPGFLTGNLHHRGGILFSLISLSILISVLCWMRKLERHGRHPENAARDVSDFHSTSRRPGTSLTSYGQP